MLDIVADFFQTETEGRALRLAERAKRIIEPNLDAITGRTVLDLASNSGRWTHALLKAGARSVVGVEGRADLVDTARTIFQRHDIRSDYEFICSDVFEYLGSEQRRFDTVMCLGLFYHVLDHYRLLTLIAHRGPSTIIVDSGFIRSFRNQIIVRAEDTSDARNALARFKGQRRELIGIVSLGMMIQMAWNLGYNCRPVPWRRDEFEAKSPAARSVVDYLGGRRFTVRLDYTGAHHDDDWRAHWQAALDVIKPGWGDMVATQLHDRLIDDNRTSEQPGFTIMDD